MKDITKLQNALKELWPKLPAKNRDHLEMLVVTGHEYLLALRSGTATKPKHPISLEILFLYSLLHDDPDGLLAEMNLSELPPTHVGADGQIYFGNVDYDSTDPYWAYCIWAWNKTGPTAPFVDKPAVIKIPDTVTLAILGDWGGNNVPAKQVASAAKSLNPDIFLHLGDIYYASTDKDGTHDMYAHAIGYFNALASPIFCAQAGCSYFALFNSGFRFVGLDSTYYDSDKSSTVFMNGILNAT